MNELEKAKLWTASRVKRTIGLTFRAQNMWGKVYIAYVRSIAGYGIAIVKLSNGDEIELTTATIADSINCGAPVVV